jgi:hypothetical protein
MEECTLVPRPKKRRSANTSFVEASPVAARRQGTRAPILRVPSPRKLCGLGGKLCVVREPEPRHRKGVEAGAHKSPIIE